MLKGSPQWRHMITRRSGLPPTSPPGPGGGASKKSSSRRNAWGNLSYADLITQAIQSSPEGRLTLSQVYEWMVQNIPYFKDKGDSNSSAGWKVGHRNRDQSFWTHSAWQSLRSLPFCQIVVLAR